MQFGRTSGKSAVFNLVSVERWCFGITYGFILLSWLPQKDGLNNCGNNGNIPSKFRMNGTEAYFADYKWILFFLKEHVWIPIFFMRHWQILRIVVPNCCFTSSTVSFLLNVKVTYTVSLSWIHRLYSLFEVPGV